LVEQQTFNLRVDGSRPSGGTGITYLYKEKK